MVHLLLANARVSLVLCRAQQCVPLRGFTSGKSLGPRPLERGHSLRSVHAILDTHYLSRDPALGENAIRKLEKGISK